MKAYRFYGLFILIILLSNKSIAQFNDSTHHLVNIASSGSFNSTADGITYLLNNAIRYGYKDDDFVFNGSAKWVYGNTPEKLTNNDFTSSLDFNLNKTFPHFYYWGLLNFTTSYSLRINQQGQAGLGIAYRIIDQKNMMLSISEGVLHEQSDLVKDDNPHAVYSTFRNSLRLQYRLLHKNIVKASFIGYYQPSLEYAHDYIISTVTTVDVKVWKWLSLNATFTYNNISRTNRENVLITYGLIAERFF